MAALAPIALPTPPPNLTVIRDEYVHGSYIVGHDQFTLATFRLTSVFHRELTSADDFLLGVLSILLIAILSDITHTILLRGTTNRFSLLGLFTAFMVDEATHFRNVARLMRRARKLSESRAMAPPVAFSALVLAIVAALFVADVVIVVVTQPRRVRSGPYDYNVRGAHPVLTKDGLAKWVRRMAINRPCIAPAMVNGTDTQSRRFHINACLLHDGVVSDDARRWKDPVAVDSVNITSVFHVGGSEHNVSFPGGWLSFSIRVQAVASTESVVRYVLFDLLDDDTFNNTRYLHTLVLAHAKAYACARKRKQTRELCKPVKRDTQASAHELVERNVSAWHGKKGKNLVLARGVSTRFDETLPLPFHALDSGIRVLAACAAIREVQGPGFYGSTRNDSVTHTGDGMLEEESRIGGVVLLSVLTVVALALMLALRVWLQPTSLSSLAAESVDANIAGASGVLSWIGPARDARDHSVPGTPHSFDSAPGFGLRYSMSSPDMAQIEPERGGSGRDHIEAEAATVSRATARRRPGAVVGGPIVRGAGTWYDPSGWIKRVRCRRAPLAEAESERRREREPEEFGEGGADVSAASFL